MDIQGLLKQNGAVGDLSLPRARVASGKPHLGAVTSGCEDFGSFCTGVRVPSPQSLQGQRLRRSRDTHTEMQKWLPREERAKGLRVTGAQQGLRQLDLLPIRWRKRAEEERGRSGDLSQRLGLTSVSLLGSRSLQWPRACQITNPRGSAPVSCFQRLSYPGHKFQSHLPRRELGFLTQPRAAQSA